MAKDKLKTIIRAFILTPALYRLQLEIEKQDTPEQKLKNMLKTIRAIAAERRLYIKRILGKEVEFMEMSRGKYYKSAEMEEYES